MPGQYHHKRILSRKEFEISLQGHAKPVHRFCGPQQIAAAGEKSASICAICGQKYRPVVSQNRAVGRQNTPVASPSRPVEPPNPVVGPKNPSVASENRPVEQRNAPVVDKNRHVEPPNRPVVSKNRPVGSPNRPVGQLNATFSVVYDESAPAANLRPPQNSTFSTNSSTCAGGFGFRRASTTSSRVNRSRIANR